MTSTKESTKVGLAALNGDEETIAKRFGLERYRLIMERFSKVDVSKNVEFQHTFTCFYKVREPAAWLKRFYGEMERMKTLRDISFREILPVVSYLSDKPKLQMSFSTKVAHTFNPDLPIWDQFVAKNLGIKQPLQNGPFDKRMESAYERYDELKRKSDALLQKGYVTSKLAEWDTQLPSYTWLTKAKKLDFLLWAK